MSRRKKRLTQALAVLTDLGLPRAQQNERTALCLLALLDLRPARAWAEAGAPLVGITPIMDWSRKHYAKPYAPNTRETFRRQSMHQFVQAGIALYKPDVPARP
ncbi:MAG: restriction endonuclease, partial [bacterium]